MRNRETTPIINVLAPQDIRDDFITRYLNFCSAKEGTVVEWHKSKLGRQDYCWTGFRRHWVWEDEDFRIYVNNVAGIGFEVPVGYSSEEALRAWDKYEKLMLNEKEVTMRTFEIEYLADWDYCEPHCVRVIDYSTDGEIYEALINGDEVVAQPEIEIVFDYPLSQAVTLSFSNDGSPFLRRDFWRAVYEGYTQIYREEDEAVGVTGPIPGMCNRATSDGPHGIWGHDMGDLYLEGVTEVGHNKFELLMGS